MASLLLGAVIGATIAAGGEVARTDDPLKPGRTAADVPRVLRRLR